MYSFVEIKDQIKVDEQILKNKFFFFFFKLQIITYNVYTQRYMSWLTDPLVSKLFYLQRTCKFRQKLANYEEQNKKKKKRPSSLLE